MNDNANHKGSNWSGTAPRTIEQAFGVRQPHERTYKQECVRGTFAVVRDALAIVGFLTCIALIMKFGAVAGF